MGEGDNWEKFLNPRGEGTNPGGAETPNPKATKLHHHPRTNAILTQTPPKRSQHDDRPPPPPKKPGPRTPHHPPQTPKNPFSGIPPPIFLAPTTPDAGFLGDAGKKRARKGREGESISPLPKGLKILWVGTCSTRGAKITWACPRPGKPPGPRVVAQEKGNWELKKETRGPLMEFLRQIGPTGPGGGQKRRGEFFWEKDPERPSPIPPGTPRASNPRGERAPPPKRTPGFFKTPPAFRTPGAQTRVRFHQSLSGDPPKEPQKKNPPGPAPQISGAPRRRKTETKKGAPPFPPPKGGHFPPGGTPPQAVLNPASPGLLGKKVQSQKGRRRPLAQQLEGRTPGGG